MTAVLLSFFLFATPPPILSNRAEVTASFAAQKNIIAETNILFKKMPDNILDCEENKNEEFFSNRGLWNDIPRWEKGLATYLPAVLEDVS